MIGGAVNDIPDPNSMVGLGYETRAFLWENGLMQDLGTLPGGTDAQALLVNERGEVLGWSYTSSVPSAACALLAGLSLRTSTFLWDKEHGMVDVGGFGGSCTLAGGLNNRGQIAGGSYFPGDNVSHAFLWDRATGLKDLPTLGGDIAGAFAINDAGEAVGGSWLEGNVQIDAALWRKGGITDLGVVAGDCGSFDGTVFVNLADKYGTEPMRLKLVRSAEGSYAQSNVIADLRYDRDAETLWMTEARSLDMIRKEGAHRDFPFDSASFAFDLKINPPVDLRVIRLQNRVAGFVMDCRSLKATRSDAGGFHIEFGLSRNPLVQLTAVVLRFAAAVFLVLIAFVRSESLPTSVASFFLLSLVRQGNSLLSNQDIPDPVGRVHFDSLRNTTAHIGVEACTRDWK